MEHPQIAPWPDAITLPPPEPSPENVAGDAWAGLPGVAASGAAGEEDPFRRLQRTNSALHQVLDALDRLLAAPLATQHSATGRQQRAALEQRMRHLSLQVTLLLERTNQTRDGGATTGPSTGAPEGASIGASS